MDAAYSIAKVFVIRLQPHDDLKKCLQQFAQQYEIKAGIVLTCVGSLEQYNLRFANQQNTFRKKGYFEIVSLTGTFSETSSHLHASVSDSMGHTIGGHLADENLIYTTAEIAVAELPDLCFHRNVDPTYGYHELTVSKKTGSL